MAIRQHFTCEMAIELRCCWPLPVDKEVLVFSPATVSIAGSAPSQSSMESYLSSVSGPQRGLSLGFTFQFLSRNETERGFYNRGCEQLQGLAALRWSSVAGLCHKVRRTSGKAPLIGRGLLNGSVESALANGHELAVKILRWCPCLLYRRA